MSKNKEKLKRICELTVLKDCNIPVIVCDTDWSISYFNESAKEKVPHIAEGVCVLGLLPTELPTQLSEDDFRCAICQFQSTVNEFSSAAVVRGTVGKIPYYAWVLRDFPLSPPEEDRWYINKTFSHLASSMDKLMTRSHELPTNIARYISQINRLSIYNGSFYLQIPPDTNINEILRDIVNSCTPMLSTLGVCVDIEYTDALYTVIDCPAVPACDLIATSVFLLVTVSNNGRIRINRQPVEGTRLIEYTIKTGTSKKNLENIKSFSDIIAYPTPICLDLAAMKDRADAFGVVFDMRQEDGELVLYLRSKGKLSDSIELRSPEFTEHIHRHFASLCAALYDLAKLSVYDKEC